MILKTLTPSEEVLMRIIWQNGEMYTKDIIALYPEPKPHHNTISTFLKILTEKQYLETEKQGRIFLYKSAVPFEDYRKMAVEKLITDFFDNDVQGLQNFLQSAGVQKENTRNEDIRKFVAEITAEKKNKKKKKKSKKS